MKIIADRDRMPLNKQFMPFGYPRKMGQHIIVPRRMAKEEQPYGKSPRHAHGKREDIFSDQYNASPSGSRLYETMRLASVPEAAGSRARSPLSPFQPKSSRSPPKQSSPPK